MKPPATLSPMVSALTTGVAAERYLRQRRRSRVFFDDIARAGATFERPIPLRQPFVFYEGHLPAFVVNTLLKLALGRPGLDARYEELFARGIDPKDESSVPEESRWPPREEVLAYVAAAEAAVVETLESLELQGTAAPAVAREAVHTILEHEAMHQETLLYMAHRLEPSRKRPPAGFALETAGSPPEPRAVRIPAGVARLGKPPELPFGWDNELPPQRVEVPAFSLDVYDVTNRDYLSFVEAGGYRRRELWSDAGWAWREEHGVAHPLFWEAGTSGKPGKPGDWLWRGMYQRVPLPAAWPVWVSGEEAAAYARWAGRRLPTEPELQRAAYGTPEGDERSYPWGEAPPDATRGRFDFQGPDPVPVGSRPAGASAFGIHDLVGNGWEWTSTVFAGFPGFRPMATYPQYSADFFDGAHWVLKGASPATDRSLLRKSLRNWFRPNYPYVYASFRCASS